MLFLRTSIFQKRSPKLPKVTVVIAMITTKSNTRQDIGGKSLRVVFGYCLKTKEKKDEDYGGKER